MTDHELPARDITSIPLERRILTVRGVKVMLDADLAALYGVETRALNQAVRRNPHRFPSDFVLQVTMAEITEMTSPRVTSHLRHGGRRKGGLAFTEQGIAMLSSVLQSQRAVEINIAIMRAFARMRDVVSIYADLRRRINELEDRYSGLEHRYDGQFARVFDALRDILQATTPAFGKRADTDPSETKTPPENPAAR